MSYKMTVLLKNGKKIRSRAKFDADERAMFEQAVPDESRLVSVTFSMGRNRPMVDVRVSEIAAIFFKERLF